MMLKVDNGAPLAGVVNYGTDVDTQKEDKNLRRFRISSFSLDSDSPKQTITNQPGYEETTLNPQNLAHFKDDSKLEVTIDKVEDHAYGISFKHLPQGHDNSILAHDTQTLAYMTHDAVPMSIFYRNAVSIEKAAANSKRPTLDLLHKGNGQQHATKRHWDASKELEQIAEEIDVENSPKAPNKLGWIKGVLMPTLLNIWGVLLFIRIPMVVGNMGIGYATVAVLVATTVTIITVMSMSAVCTNGAVRGGGVYYMISRSLGPQFGGSIGLIFSIAKTLAISLHLVGFGEVVVHIMEEHHVKMVGGDNDIRIIGILALIFVFVVTVIGLDYVINALVFVLVLQVIAIIGIIIGTGIPSPEKSREWATNNGVPGLSRKLFVENFGPGYRDGKGFFDIFAIIFPAFSGIMGGANLSGDLKDPSRAVPLGTLPAIGISSGTYLILFWMIGSSTTRDVQIFNKNSSGLTNYTTSFPALNKTYSNLVCDASVSTKSGMCNFGTTRDMQIIEKISIWGPLVFIGIFASAFSSALTSLVGAPKVFQAVCKDKLFPGIGIFSKGHGKRGEPRYGYVLILILSSAFIAIGKLDVIAPIISNFFLMAYAAINYAVFQSSLSKSPGWRPTFKFYNMWISLFGFLLCIAIMFLINWWAALVTIAVVAALYIYVDIRRPDINWGSAAQAYSYLKALRFARRLDDVADHVKNYRVQVLCLSGQPSSRPNLVDFASHITKHYGLLACSNIVITDRLTPPNIQSEFNWLKKRKIKSFYRIIQDVSLRSGVRCLLQAYGLGKLRPNTILIGYMNRWEKSSAVEVDEYVQTVHDAFDLRYGVGILRLQDGLDITSSTQNASSEDPENIERALPVMEFFEGNEDIVQGSGCKSTIIQPDIVKYFHKKRKGHIDVWWLYDDGGLTILIPHILSTSSHWRDCKLRIFTPASDQKIKANQIQMATLLKKFRIDFSSVVEFHGINKLPKEESINDFKKLRNGEHLKSNNELDEKTLRQIRIGELLREHSHEAVLVVLTLPVPNQSIVSSLMYMSWLEVLSADLPPVLLIRGNQDSVLTYYS